MRLNVLELLYLLLCQASVADAAVPGRPDDGAACEEESGQGGGAGGDREEDKIRAGAESPGNVGATQHIVTLTDASLHAQITGLGSGHLAVSTELLLSIKCILQTHTQQETPIPARIQFQGGRERERRASYLQLMNYVWAQQETEKRREESETIAAPYRDLKEKDKSGEIDSSARKSGEQIRQRWGGHMRKLTEEDYFNVKSLVPDPAALS